MAPDDVTTYDDVANSEVAGVLPFDNFLMCITCKSKVDAFSDDKLGTCSSCEMIQKVNLCSKQVRAKLLVTRAGGNYITLTVFDNHLNKICEQETVTPDNLLTACPFNFTYKDQIINTISR